MTYRITVRKRTRDIAFIHVTTIKAVYEALRELRYQYPRCFFILKCVEHHLENAIDCEALHA